jgi:hypothetical protein
MYLERCKFIGKSYDKSYSSVKPLGAFWKILTRRCTGDWETDNVADRKNVRMGGIILWIMITIFISRYRNRSGAFEGRMGFEFSADGQCECEKAASHMRDHGRHCESSTAIHIADSDRMGRLSRPLRAITDTVSFDPEDVDLGSVRPPTDERFEVAGADTVRDGPWALCTGNPQEGGAINHLEKHWVAFRHRRSCVSTSCSYTSGRSSRAPSLRTRIEGLRGCNQRQPKPRQRPPGAAARPGGKRLGPTTSPARGAPQSRGPPNIFFPRIEIQIIHQLSNLITR